MKVSYSKFDAIAGEDLADRKVVYLSDADIVKLAKADSETTLPAVGFTDGSALNEESVRVITNDLLDGFVDLVAGNSYYLSQTNAGEIVNVKPSSGIIVRLGVAKSSTELDVHILEIKKVENLQLKIIDLVENVDGINNNVDVDKYIDATNGKVGKRTTGNADNQDCDFDILLLLPSGFIGFDTNSIELDVRASDITGNNNIMVRIYGTDNNEVGSGFDLTPTSADTWQTKVITTSQLSSGTFIAGQMFRIRIHITVDNTDTIDMSDGEVKFA